MRAADGVLHDPARCAHRLLHRSWLSPGSDRMSGWLGLPRPLGVRRGIAVDLQRTMNEPRRRILFVDDEQMILTGLRHGLRKQVGRWDMVFAATGAAALDELAAASFDVIVSDMRMPNMDGVTLLETVRRLHPLTARIILTGYAEADAISSVFV